LIEAIKQDLVSSGSGFVDGRQRIQQILDSEESVAVKAKRLKDEYGIGGGSRTLALYDRCYQSHDSKGIEYVVWEDEGDPKERIMFTWSQVLSMYIERGVH
jgi:hypothetical protein